MKILVLFSCAFAVATAAWAPNNHGYHIPVLVNGVPQETPEVQAARASHLAAFSGAAGNGGHNNWNNGGNSWNDNGNSWNEGTNPEHLRYYGPHAYQTTNGVAHVSQDGIPIDTPEVAAAKATHFGLFSEALSRDIPSHHYRRRRSLYAGAWAHGIHIPVIGPLGVPLDTPEVQHARAAHLGALAAAGGHGGYAHAAPILGHAHGFYGLDHDGRPLDTPEVAHAKAAHYAAYNSAAVLNGVGHVGLGHVGIHGGVPIDTPEVQHAKAAHFAAHAAARGHY